jgi:hypothetical protein
MAGHTEHSESRCLKATDGMMTPPRKLRYDWRV